LDPVFEGSNPSAPTTTGGGPVLVGWPDFTRALDHRVEPVLFDHRVEPVLFDHRVEPVLFEQQVESVLFEQRVESVLFDHRVESGSMS
jgi:hypothetical protein